MCPDDAEMNWRSCLLFAQWDAMVRNLFKAALAHLMELCIKQTTKKTFFLKKYCYIGEQSVKANKIDVSYLSSAVTISIPIYDMESLSHMTCKDTLKKAI